MVQRILKAGDIESLDHSVMPRILAPEREDVFRARAARFRQLAARENPIADYLLLMAKLADAQHQIAAHLSVTAPDIESMARARTHAMPLIPALRGARDPAWRDVLTGLLERLESAGPHAPALTAVLDQLQTMTVADLEAQADAICAQRLAEVEPASAPFIAAALQVVWTNLVADISERDVPYLETLGLCPLCGSVPVASIIRVGGTNDGYRFLQCGLCASQWHMVRSKCSHCDSTKGIAYHALGSPDADRETAEVESKAAALKAESCDECSTYRKIGNQAKDYDFEPFADDLASIALDILMGEEGYSRAAPHPWLWPEQGVETATDDARAAGPEW